MRDCHYCRGTGIQYVESGSSLCYSCPDCNGTGLSPTCDRCGNTFIDEYCENCYTVCEACRTIKSIDEEMVQDDTICDSCIEAVAEARKVLHNLNVSSHPITDYELADICYEADFEVVQHLKALHFMGKRPEPGRDVSERYDRNIYEVSISDKYCCPSYATTRCGFCGELGIEVNYISTEEDSDGPFENWNASCIHCGRKSVDMNDPKSAIDIIVNGEKGEVVDVD